MGDTLPPDYFREIYAAKPDPWDFATSEYEAGKYRQTIAALTRDRYRKGFEIGCSIGVLTAQLAARCGRLLSVDVSETALEQARQRCASLPNIEFQLLGVPADYPQDSFDLTILSETGYYLSFGILKNLRYVFRSALFRRGSCCWYIGCPMLRITR